MVSIDYENSFGFALQAGIDIGIDDHWAINLDLKKVFLNTDVSLNGGAITADLDLDPWLFGLGVAYSLLRQGHVVGEVEDAVADALERLIA